MDPRPARALNLATERCRMAETLRKRRGGGGGDALSAPLLQEEFDDGGGSYEGDDHDRLLPAEGRDGEDYADGGPAGLEPGGDGLVAGLVQALVASWGFVVGGPPACPRQSPRHATAHRSTPPPSTARYQACTQANT